MNLVEIRVTVFELLRYIGALRTDGQTDGRTDRQTQLTTIPVRPYWPRGKNDMIPINIFRVIVRTS